MTVWHRRGRSGIVAALLVLVGAAGAVAYLSAGPRQTSGPAAAAGATAAPRELRTAVSVQVVSRVDKASCAAGTGGVPGPGDGGDWCYFLDSGLELTRAQRVEFVHDMSGTYGVAVTLAPADRDRFATWTGQAAGRQIAIRVQGRVVGAPQLEERLSGESLDILSLTEADARALSRQLWH